MGDAPIASTDDMNALVQVQVLESELAHAMDNYRVGADIPCEQYAAIARVYSVLSNSIDPYTRYKESDVLNVVAPIIRQAAIQMQATAQSQFEQFSMTASRCGSGGDPAYPGASNSNPVTMACLVILAGIGVYMIFKK